jgi:adenylate cyclase
MARSGLLRVFAGQPDVAIEHFQNYLRLSPRDRMATYLNGIGEAHFFSRRFDEAAANLLPSLDLAPTFPITYRVLASCYGHMDRLDSAREIVSRLRAITPAVMEPATRYRNPELRELFLSGLCLAAGEELIPTHRLSSPAAEEHATLPVEPDPRERSLSGHDARIIGFNER